MPSTDVPQCCRSPACSGSFRSQFIPHCRLPYQHNMRPANSHVDFCQGFWYNPLYYLLTCPHELVCACAGASHEIPAGLPCSNPVCCGESAHFPVQQHWRQIPGGRKRDRSVMGWRSCCWHCGTPILLFLCHSELHTLIVVQNCDHR